MDSTQNTISQNGRFQETEEEPFRGIQQHFPQAVPTRAVAETRSPSRLNLPRQAQLHGSHRNTTPFPNDPFLSGTTTANLVRNLPETAPSAAPAGLTSTETATSADVGRLHAIKRNSSAQPVAVRSVTAQTVSRLPIKISRHLPTVNTNQDGTTLHLHERRLTPYQVIALEEAEATADSTATNLGLGRSQADETAGTLTTSRIAAPTASSSRAPAATLVTTSVAGGKGPPGPVPDGSTDNRRMDRRSESTFYRNATYTRGTTNNSAPPPFVLKEVPLTPFDGDIREYPRFRDRFLDIMEAFPNLEPRYKLVHLLQYLRGEPLRMANQLHLTDDNYFIIVDRLENRYGNKGLLRSVLRRDLVHLADLQSTKLSDLTRFYDDAFQVVTDLQPLITDWDVDYQVLMGKIPKRPRAYLMKETSFAKDQTVNGLLNALDELIRLGRVVKYSDLSASSDRELEDPDMIPLSDTMEDDASSTRTFEEDNPEGAVSGPQQCPSEPTDDERAVTVNASTEPRLKERRTCPLCGLLHTAYSCTTFRTVNGRLRRIQKLKLCLLCLKEGHNAVKCLRKTTDSCNICNKGPHNRAVCMTANERARASTRRRSPTRASGSSVDPKLPDQERHTQKKSVNWADTKSVPTATNLRQSETQSSPGGDPKITRKKRSKKPGTAPSGRNGTTRPPTKSTAESMKPKTTGACGDSRLLPARQRLQPTDRCSNNESTQLDHTAFAGGSARETFGKSSDASEQHELREAEEDSFPESSGSDSDTPSSTLNEPQDSTTFQSDAVHTASSTDEQTTLLECIRATAENPDTGISREVLILFDSGSTRSFASMELARDLSLPQHWACSHRVNTFGSELLTTIEGFSTSVVLRSKHRLIPSLAFTAGNCIVPSVRTALVESSDLPKLRRGELSPSPQQATPDILIGQDLASHFKRQYGPTLPSGFYVVNSILGPMLGGSGKVPPTVSAAAPSSSAVTSASVARRPSRLSEATHPSPTLPMNPRRKHLTAPSAEKCAALASKSDSAETDPDAPSVATYQDFSLPFEKNEFSRSTMSTASCTKRRLLSSRAEGPPPLRKHPNPLDTTAPLPPSSTIHVTLHPELSADPCILTSCDPVYDCGPQDSAQQYPALNNTRKTRLRRRSSSLGRPVLGKNHEELRRCEPMRHLLDQSRPTISTSTHVVPDDRDPDAHPEHHPFPGARFPDVVLVAAEDTSIDPPSYTGQHPPPTLAAHRNDRAPTRSPALYSGNRTEPPQLQLTPVRSSFAGPTEPITSLRTPSVPRSPPISKRTLSVPRSQHRPNRLRKPLRGDETRGDLQRSVSSNYTGRTPRSNTTRNQQTNLTTEPPCRKQKYRTATGSQADQGHGMPNSARGDPSRTLTGSKQHSTAKTRCASPHSQGRRRPCTASQDAGATATNRPLIPIHHHHELFEKLTDTPKDVLIKESANALNTIYHLKFDLPSRANTACDGCDDYKGLTSEDPSEQLHVASGPARRADHDDQGIGASRCPPSVDATQSAAPDAHFLPHVATQAKCRRCAFCGRPHWSARCTIYATANIRMRRLVQLNQCFICLGRSHGISACPLHSMNACKYCHQGQHHVALCHSFVPPPTPETAHSAAPNASNLPHAASQATCRICAFCDDPHPSTECKTYHLVKQRLRRLQESKRCFPCLCEGHPSSTCPQRTTTTCRHCHNGQHHPAICRVLRQHGAATAIRQVSTELLATLPAADNPRTITAADAPDLVAEAASTRRDTASRFPLVMNHFRRIGQPPSTATERVVQAVSRSAKKRSAAIPPPAQAPSSQPQRPHNKRTATNKSGHQVHAPSLAELNSSSRSKHVKTSNKQRIRKRSSPPKTTLSVAKETLNHASHGEKKEHPSRDAKTYHRSKDTHQKQPVTAPIEPIQRADTRCELCAQRHRAERCTSFSSTEKRRQRAQHLWLCFACLDQGHRTEDCPHSSSCSLCGCSSHHPALCTKACRLQDEQATRIHLAEAHSTPVVVPAEAYHQLLTPLSGETDSQANVRALPQSATGSSGPDLPANLVSPLGERTLLRAAQLIPEQAAVQAPVPTDAELDRTEAPLDQRSKDRPPSMAQKRRARKRKTRKPKK